MRLPTRSVTSAFMRARGLVCRPKALVGKSLGQVSGSFVVEPAQLLQLGGTKPKRIRDRVEVPEFQGAPELSLRIGYPIGKLSAALDKLGVIPNRLAQLIARHLSGKLTDPP